MKTVMKNDIKIFEDKQVRTIWNADEEEWYFSAVDVIAVLTDSPNPRKIGVSLRIDERQKEVS